MIYQYLPFQKNNIIVYKENSISPTAYFRYYNKTDTTILTNIGFTLIDNNEYEDLVTLYNILWSNEPGHLYVLRYDNIDDLVNVIKLEVRGIFTKCLLFGLNTSQQRMLHIFN